MYFRFNSIPSGWLSVHYLARPACHNVNRSIDFHFISLGIQNAHNNIHQTTHSNTIQHDQQNLLPRPSSIHWWSSQFIHLLMRHNLYICHKTRTNALNPILFHIQPFYITIDIHHPDYPTFLGSLMLQPWCCLLYHYESLFWFFLQTIASQSSLLATPVTLWFMCTPHLQIHTAYIYEYTCLGPSQDVTKIQT